MGKTNKNSAVNKADLARAGTMEVTTKEGRAYLEKNLTEWKKPLLLEQETTELSDEVADNNDDAHVEPPPAKKAKLSKATTMDATTKEGKALLGGKKLGDTRQVTKAAQKKTAMKRAGTMQQAVAEAAAVYGDLTNYGKTQQPSAAKKPETAAKKRPKKAKTVKKSPAKKSAKKGTMKKYGTMFNTAKEATQLLGGEKLGDTRQVTKAKKGKKCE